MTQRETATNRSRPAALLALGLAILLLVLLLTVNPFVEVAAGQRAVLFSLSKGVLNRQLGEGMHVIVPFVERPVFYDVRTRTYTMSEVNWEGEIKGDDSLSAPTKDGQILKIDISIRFHPDPEKVWRLHQRVGPNYVDKIIRPEIRSQTRLAIAQYPAEAAYSSSRDEVERLIGDRLKASLQPNDIIVDEVLLRNVQFSPAYADAVELKQIAQQRAQRMLYVLEQAKLDKQKRILEAQGDARSIQLRGQAIRENARVIQYEYARKLAPNVETIVTDGRGGRIPFSAGAGEK